MFAMFAMLATFCVGLNKNKRNFVPTKENGMEF